MRKVALYARVSTDDQDPQRQLEELQEYAQQNYPDHETETYADRISGTEDGEEYRRLWEDIGEDRLQAVVVHEISRLSRLGAGEIEEFISHALEHDTAVEDLEVGLSLRVEDSDMQRAMYELLATVMGKLADIERKQTLRRIRSGIRSAREAGKWTGRPPVGFTVENGYLRVDPEEFLRVQDALQRVLAGETIVDVAEEVGLAESTLRRLRDERRSLYLDTQAEDERVSAALEDAGIESVDAPRGDLEARVRALEDALDEDDGRD
ncbi:recombinase family protein [Salinirubellus sp. GCM10025818]|uniref:recombinase family protein n=1 Tax=unclassified Salinirubellus TaxID=2627207 RepID=UPI00360FB91D